MLEQKIGQWGNTFVLRRILEPGAATAWHIDPFRRLTVVVRGGALSIEFRDCGEAIRAEVGTGTADWDEPTARVHRAVNVGRQTYEEVVVFFPDGVVMPADDPEQHFLAGRYNRMPVIAGTNRDESKLFMAFDREYVRLWFRVLPSVRDEDRYERDAHYQSLAWKLNGADDPVRWMRSIQGPSAFAYRFDWDELDRFLWADWSRLIGAGHAMEIPFVLGDFDIPLLRRLYREHDLASREQLARTMMSYWAELAYNGAPGRGRGGDLPVWSAWDESGPDSERFLVFDSAAGGGTRMSSDSVTATSLVNEMIGDDRFESADERCAFLARLQAWRRPLPAEDVERAGCPTADRSGG